MDDTYAAINRQYGRENMSGRILSALEAAGKDLDRLTLDDLAGFDQMHYGGREGTLNLSRLAELDSSMHMVDIGSGLGGPARTLANEYGCRVVGVDLTEEFVTTAEMLTDRLGLGEQVSFRQGSALDLPLEDQTFDAAWTQNAIMNIEDKHRVFAEAYRVLRPGGKLFVESILAGSEPGLQFPVFWANTSDVSHLATVDELKTALAQAGFVELKWLDVTPEPPDETQEEEGERPLPVQIDVVYDDVPTKRENTMRGFENRQLENIYTLQQRPAE